MTTALLVAQGSPTYTCGAPVLSVRLALLTGTCATLNGTHGREVSIFRPASRRRRRLNPGVLLAGASALAVLAAAVPAVGGLVSATVRPVANYWKWEGNAEHYRSGGHGKDASALADRAQNTRCAGASFRRSHLAFCPATRSRSQITAVPAGRRTANEVVNTGQWGFGPTNPVRPSPFLLPNYAINQVLLPTGKILLISKPTESPTAPEVKPRRWQRDCPRLRSAHRSIPRGGPTNDFRPGRE